MNRKIKRLRELNGYTQQQIADYLEISQPLYSQVEKCKRPLKDEYIEPLALLYGFTLHEIITEPLTVLEDKAFGIIYRNIDFVEYALSNDVSVELPFDKGAVL